EYHFIPERPHVKPRRAKRAPAKKVQPVPNCHDCYILSKEVARLRRRVLALEQIFGSLGQETHLKKASGGRNCHSVINHQVPRIVEQAPKHAVPNSLNASRQALLDERVDNRSEHKHSKNPGKRLAIMSPRFKDNYLSPGNTRSVR
ncbi:hypothetical protein I7I51_01250, partial [Histoplasma capsulatum]